ncbi:ubiquinone biosynthesis protein COQ4 homolog, mitochondrial-like [Agrilus planipennis]|uniref:Ubiquinone biosynthesis protein COQ4 homolog, mitochondrial n=1 Tax=Agrilus planipennis TaxID=224129 RepID=A0A1W4XAT8_AGRPL|nr:ubiquinone biosynthesis protein COQ4 homolog, mitochondrial-like [Agrilus planipennis]
MKPLNVWQIPNQFLLSYNRVLQILSAHAEVSSKASNSFGDFDEDFAKNYIETTSFQKFLLALGSGYVVLRDPFKVHMSTCFSETTGLYAAGNLLKRVESTEEGRRLLMDKPRVNSKTIDLEKLKHLPDDTFGKAYFNFLFQNNLTPDSRHVVRFIKDINVAYVIQRYREIHDFVHTVLGMPPNTLGETTVKWVEAYQTKLPYCVMGVIFGPLSIPSKKRSIYFKYYAPWGFQTAKDCKFLYNIYFEKRWEQPLTELRDELCIETLNLPQQIKL